MIFSVELAVIAAMPARAFIYAVTVRDAFSTIALKPSVLSAMSTPKGRNGVTAIHPEG